MHNEEIKLMREIGDKIIQMTNEFYSSKKAYDYQLFMPHSEIRDVLSRFSSEFYMRAKLHEYEKLILDCQNLGLMKLAR